jgi:S1-C subfamily serine protease
MGFGTFTGTTGVAAVAFAVLCRAASAQAVECQRSAEELYATAGDSVVQVVALLIDPYRVLGRISPRLGSGFVIDGGYVLTSYHIVVDSEDITLFLDDEAYGADIVGIDPTLDLALLRPLSEGDIAPPLVLAHPADIAVGQQVFAIGYPFGVGKSITAGIVSGTNRIPRRTTSDWLSPYIQTDAAISSGSSGGPLLDSCGQVVGLITSRIIAPDAEGIGFAIPSAVLAPVAAELAETGRVSRPWHGLYGQMVTPLILLLLGAPPEDWENLKGFLVETVEPGSAAERAGILGGYAPMMWGGTEILLGGDIITEVNGTRIDTLGTALDVVRGLKVGDTVEIRGLRDGIPFDASVVLDERPLLEREMDFYRYLETP